METANVQAMVENENSFQRYLKKFQGYLKKLVGVRELFLIVLIIVMGLILTNMSPAFLSHANFRSLSIGMVQNAIIAIGMTILLAGGNFDLSVGTGMALAGTVCGMLLVAGTPIWLAVFLTMVMGAGIGLLNGLTITKLGVNPLIATFAMMSITRSVAQILTDGYSVVGLPKAFNLMGSKYILGFPLMVWIMLALVIIGDLLLRNSRYLRQVFFIGGNEKAALLSGIKVDKVKVISYIATGCLVATAGIILSSRLMAGTPNAGSGLELNVIAACVIGGASLNGGEGTVIGSFLGVIFLSLINNALVLMSISLFWQGVVSGLILIIAVTLDMWIKKRKERK